MATAAQRLVEAEDALHAILTGSGIQRVQDQSGESVTYTTANVGRLRAYIAELKAEIAGVPQVRGPIRPMFF